MELNHPEATAAALSILRRGEPFQWYVVTLFALALYAYVNEISKRNWRVVAGGLALYLVHWSVEIVNALIQHFSGHALWTVPSAFTRSDRRRHRDQPDVSAVAHCGNATRTRARRRRQSRVFAVLNAA
jgi:hypothetical protein